MTAASRGLVWGTRLGLGVAIAFWIWAMVHWPVYRLFICFVPLAVLIRWAPSIVWRNTAILVLAVLWTVLFHYESLRYYYRTPLFPSEPPKTKFLFPPAGWIMFYQVDNAFGYTEVYGVKDGKAQFIDPHDIFRTRTIGFDNIHRGILGSAADRRAGEMFCGFLERRFPYFDGFMVTINYHPDITREPYKRFQELKYQCVKSSEK